MRVTNEVVDAHVDREGRHGHDDVDDPRMLTCARLHVRFSTRLRQNTHPRAVSIGRFSRPDARLHAIGPQNKHEAVGSRLSNYVKLLQMWIIPDC